MWLLIPTVHNYQRTYAKDIGPLRHSRTEHIIDGTSEEVESYLKQELRNKNINNILND